MIPRDPLDRIYEGAVYRPPSEATSLILQATIGCSHNRCTFCVSYLGKRFRVRSPEELEADLRVALRYHRGARRVFLADGDALAAPTGELLEMLRMLRRRLPRLERVGLYGSPMNIRSKSGDELRALREAGLGIVYMGLESGSDAILRSVRKGALSGDMVSAARKLREAGIALSVIWMLGLGGRERTEEHARETARVLSAMDPEYAAALTLMLVEPAPICREVEAGRLTPLSPRETLEELRRVVLGIELSGCLLRANHASNYVQVRGTLPGEKGEILRQIDEALRREAFKPEWMRAL
ncbi:MAG: radical SAM protein [Thermoplasmatota archaeon]